MKKVTLEQVTKVLEIIKQSGTDGDQLQDVLESGVLTDVLTGRIKEVDFSKRNKIRILLGHRSWGEIWIERRRPGYKFGEYRSGSRCVHCDRELPETEIHGTTIDGKNEFIWPSCPEDPCREWIEREIKELIQEDQQQKRTTDQLFQSLILQRLIS